MTTLTEVTGHRRRLDRRMARRRLSGLLAIITVAVVSAGTYFSLAVGIRPITITKFEHIHRDPFVETFDPIALVEAGLSPDSRGLSYPVSEDRLRAIKVTPTGVHLIESGVTLRSLPGRAEWTIADLTTAIGDPGWIEFTPPTGNPPIDGVDPALPTVRLDAALVVSEGAALRVQGVRELTLTDSPSIFVGARRATLTFTDVVVDATDPKTASVQGYQPFVMATDDSVMDITNSRFTDLGWDWNSSYGITWAQGAHGTMVDSEVRRNFIGLYTNNAHGLRVRDSVFSDNTLYGVDPHTGSSDLVFERVTAEGNGAHGFIFSDRVVQSRIIDCVARFNGENGIMMDAESTQNVIARNRVSDNTGDGIVTAASPENTFRENAVERNRVGVRVDPPDAATTALTANRILDNGVAVENITLDRSNDTADNGGQWLLGRLRIVWACAGALWLCCAAVAVVTHLRGRSRQR